MPWEYAADVESTCCGTPKDNALFTVRYCIGMPIWLRMLRVSQFCICGTDGACSSREASDR